MCTCRKGIPLSATDARRLALAADSRQDQLLRTIEQQIEDVARKGATETHVHEFYWNYRGEFTSADIDYVRVKLLARGFSVRGCNIYW